MNPFEKISMLNKLNRKIKENNKELKDLAHQTKGMEKKIENFENNNKEIRELIKEMKI